jgi:hypothetical protein
MGRSRLLNSDVVLDSIVLDSVDCSEVVEVIVRGSVRRSAVVESAIVRSNVRSNAADTVSTVRSTIPDSDVVPDIVLVNVD